MRGVWTLLLFLSPLVQAEVYRWVDEQGGVHFGSVPPRVLPEYRPSMMSETLAPEKPARPAEPDQTSQPEPQQATRPQTPPEPRPAPATASPAEQNAVDAETLRRFAEREAELLEMIRRLREERAGGTGQAAPVMAEPVSNRNGEPGTPVARDIPSPLPAAAAIPAPGDVETQPRPAPVEGRPGPPSGENADRCGFYSAYVEEYQLRVSERCPGSHCATFQRQLKKYQDKRNHYCRALWERP